MCAEKMHQKMPRIPFFSPGDSDGTGTDKRFLLHAALLARRSASGARYAAHVADQKCCHSCFGLRLRLFSATEEFRRLAALPRILSEETSKEGFQCGYGHSGFAESSSRRGLRLPRPIRLPRYARASKDAAGLSSVIRFHDRKRQKPLALLLAADRDDFPVRRLSGRSDRRVGIGCDGHERDMIAPPRPPRERMGRTGRRDWGPGVRPVPFLAEEIRRKTDSGGCRSGRRVSSVRLPGPAGRA